MTLWMSIKISVRFAIRIYRDLHNHIHTKIIQSHFYHNEAYKMWLDNFLYTYGYATMQICLRSLVAPVRQDLDYALCTANVFRFSLLPDLLIILKRLKNSSFSGGTVSTVSTFRNASKVFPKPRLRSGRRY